MFKVLLFIAIIALVNASVFDSITLVVKQAVSGITYYIVLLLTIN